MKTLFVVATLLLFAGVFAQNMQMENPGQIMNDNKVLNFALTLEHLEATFYTLGQQRFNAAAFVAAGYTNSTWTYLDLIRAHEVAHVQLLTSALQTRNTSAVSACTYNFDAFFANVSSYLAAAMLLENTGVMAYDGSANGITDAGLLTVAATIATTEARHAAFLNELNRVFAFSNASYDTPMTPEQIFAAVGPLIQSCPPGSYQLGLADLPKIRYNFDFYPATNATTFNGSMSVHYETPAAIQNDNNLLNYALHLEQLGYAFITGAAAKFNLSDFIAAGFNQSVYQHFQLIVLHEVTHTMFLRDTLRARNSPLIVDPCVYNLNASLASVSAVMTTARMLENLEVQAYDGAIDRISDEGIVQAAATIATIEARHATYLNQLLLGQPIPVPNRDSPLTPMEILNITAPFFISCPQDPMTYLPQQYFLFSAASAPSVTVSPSFSFTTSSSPSYSYSYTPTPTRSPSPSSCGCSRPSPTPDRSGTTINFNFDGMLRGAGRY